MLNEVASFIPSNKKLKIFDATFGAGSYSRHFFELGHEVFACDLDKISKKIVKESENLKELQASNRFSLLNGNYSDIIQQFDDNYFDIIVADLGFSTVQLNFSKRGFSYQKRDELLDLRYDCTNSEPCYIKVQNLKNPNDLSKIIYNYSGEELSSKIAKVIFQTVKIDGVIAVGGVVDAIDQIIFSQNKKNFNSILSRVWQALRIWTNDEFGNLELFLEFSKSKLKKNGRLIIVNFHSLEDKIVTNYFRQCSKKRVIDDFGNTEIDFKHLTNKPVLPSEKEILENKPSRSAKLRVLERLID
jgi:16S rRNA (cytosine1402-N4)-methyltransferase